MKQAFLNIFFVTVATFAIATGARAEQACPKATSFSKPYKLSADVGRGTGVGKNFTLVKLTALDYNATTQSVQNVACLSPSGSLMAVSPIIPMIVKNSPEGFSLNAEIGIKKTARAKGIIAGNQSVKFTMQLSTSKNSSDLYKHVENDKPYDLFGTRDNGSSKKSGEIQYQGKPLKIVAGTYWVNIQVIDRKTGFGEVVYRGAVVVR